MDGTNFHLEDNDCNHERELQDLQRLNSVLDSDELLSSSSTSRLPSVEEGSDAEIRKIDEALSLNKQVDDKLKRLEIILNERLRECEFKLSQIELSKKKPKSVDKPSFCYASCGKPYFRDKSNFPAPNNEDTITMAKVGMYDFSNVSTGPGWTVKDKSQFLEELLKATKEIRRKEIGRKVSDLKREAQTNPGESIEKNIAILIKEQENIEKQLLKDIALPLDEDYDWDLIADKLNSRHSAGEYQRIWKLFLHPSINKSNWTKSEHIALEKLAVQNNFQNWDDIALKLGTQRTGYQCFVYFRTNMSNTFTGHKWTHEEEEYLKRLINHYRIDNYIPWGKVATAMENRTKIQVYNKYARLMELRKGRFLPEEDAVILTCAENFGPNFKKMTTYIPGRSSAQLRVRYNILVKRRVSTIWTIEEDKKLLKLVANEDSPTVFSSVTKYFPGKDRFHIRSRYVTLMKWIKSHPNTDICKAPRRGARRLGHGQALDNLNKAVENLKNRMQSEVDKHRCKKVTENSPESEIDDAIKAALLNRMIKKEEENKLKESEHQEFFLEDGASVSNRSLRITNIKKLLILFNSKLKKEPLSKSKYGKIYPELLHEDKDVSLIKTYSRKVSSKKVENHNPDIFGNNPLGQLNYVLPPNYDTITGCRQLMACLPDKRANKSNDVNINVSLENNALLREHFHNLIQRFNTMFLLPFMMSNESPQFESSIVKYDNLERPLPRTNNPSFGTGIVNPDLNSDPVNDTIDLEESENDRQETNIVDITNDEIDNLEK